MLAFAGVPRRRRSVCRLRCSEIVRSLAAFIAIATAAPALACPRGAHCVTDASPREEVCAPKRPLSLRIEKIPERDPWDLRMTRPPPDANELPSIWRALRERVYDRMPHVGDDDDDVTLTLAPVVVSGSFDTVPGLGVAGDF